MVDFKYVTYVRHFDIGPKGKYPLNPDFLIILKNKRSANTSRPCRPEFYVYYM